MKTLFLTLFPRFTAQYKKRIRMVYEDCEFALCYTLFLFLLSNMSIKVYIYRSLLTKISIPKSENQLFDI